MESFPAADNTKYRRHLKTLSRLTFAISILVFLGGLVAMFLLVVGLPFAGHDQPSPTPEEMKASAENADHLKPFVEVGLTSPIIAAFGVRFVNARSNRGIYLSIAAMTTLLPYGILVLLSNDAKESWELPATAFGIFGFITAAAIYMLIKERQAQHSVNSSPS